MYNILIKAKGLICMKEKQCGISEAVTSGALIQQRLLDIGSGQLRTKALQMSHMEGR